MSSGQDGRITPIYMRQNKDNKMKQELTVLAITGLVVFGITNAYADHVDNNVWIETADGKYVIETSTGIDHINSVAGSKTNDICHINNLPNQERVVINKLLTELNYDKTRGTDNTINENINGNFMLKSYAECGNKSDEESAIFEADTDNIAFKELHDYHHECLCKYWYDNTVKDEYTYTILDLPKDVIELPPNYEENIAAGIKDGLEQWGGINNIDFKYTNSRLDANIIIQQQTGNTAYGNAIPGCLFNSKQCTIQLFPHITWDNKEEGLVNRQSVEFTIAHEFGHLIGLPHHIDPDNVMNTNHANNVRTYYETGGIKVPTLREPTTNERYLLVIKEDGTTVSITPHIGTTTSTTTTRDDNTNSICDATLVTSNEVYQRIVTYPEWYQHKLVGFTGTVKNYPNVYLAIDNIPNLKNYYTVLVESTDKIFREPVREGTDIVVFGYVTTSRSATINIHAEAIYTLKNFNVCDNTSTENTPTEDTQTNNYEDDSQIWTVDNLVEHKATIELIKVIKEILTDIPVEDRLVTSIVQRVISVPIIHIQHKWAL